MSESERKEYLNQHKFMYCMQALSGVKQSGKIIEEHLNSDLNVIAGVQTKLIELEGAPLGEEIDDAIFEYLNNEAELLHDRTAKLIDAFLSFTKDTEKLDEEMSKISKQVTEKMLEMMMGACGDCTDDDCNIKKSPGPMFG